MKDDLAVLGVNVWAHNEVLLMWGTVPTGNVFWECRALR